MRPQAPSRCDRAPPGARSPGLGHVKQYTPVPHLPSPSPYRRGRFFCDPYHPLFRGPPVRSGEDMLDLEDAELESVSDILEEELLTNRGLLLQRSAFCLTGAGSGPNHPRLLFESRGAARAQTLHCTALNCECKCK